MSGGIEEMYAEERGHHNSSNTKLSANETNELYEIRKELKSLENRIELLINNRIWRANNGY